MVSVRSLIAAHVRGDATSLRALALALAAAVEPVPEAPVDPLEAYEVADTLGAEQAGTWQEVRAARDHGDLTVAEYDYLAAAVDALTMEDA